MPVTTMRELLDAGVHFGHRTARWNPKMRRYIFGARNRIHVIDLQHTVRALDRATAFLRNLGAAGGDVIFVGTKRQAQDIVKNESSRCRQHYIDHRWLGGTLTNFETLRSRLQRMRELGARQQAGEFDRLPKKDAQALASELARLEKRMGGLRNLSRLPNALFVIDTGREQNALAEARRLNIPVVAMVDTNCDPDEVDYDIPANDDAIRSIQLVTAVMADALLGGREEFEKRETEHTLHLAREAEAAMAAATRAAAQRASVADMEAAMLSAAAQVPEPAATARGDGAAGSPSSAPPVAPVRAPARRAPVAAAAASVGTKGGRRAPADRRAPAAAATVSAASTEEPTAKSSAKPAAKPAVKPAAKPRAKAAATAAPAATPSATPSATPEKPSDG